MIPAGVLSSARAAAGGLTVDHLTHSAPTSTSGTVRNFASMPLGTAGVARTLLIAAMNTWSNTAAGTLVVDGVTATRDATSPIRNYANIWRVTLTESSGATGLITWNIDAPNCTIDIWETSGPVALVAGVGALAVAGTVAAPSAAADADGFAVVCAQGRLHSASISGIDVQDRASGLTAVGHTATPTSPLTGVSASYGGSDNNAIALATYAPA